MSTAFPAHSNESSPWHPQHVKMMDHLRAADILLDTFRNSPEDLGAALFYMGDIAAKFRGFRSERPR
jgi:hypothetical protein